MDTLILIPDLQCPQQDNRAIKIACKLIEHIKPTQICYLGDVIAADSVSTYAKKTWREAQVTLQKEADTTNKVLDIFDKSFKKASVNKTYFLEGNHERRILKWAIKNTAPLGEIEGMRIENLLKFDERGYEYIMEEDQPLQISKFNIFHGWYVNQYHTAKTIRMAGRNAFYGHTHDYQVHTSSHFETEPPRIAMSCGCLCDFQQDFMRGKPNNWVHGLTVIYHNKDVFTPYFIPIVNYKAYWNGRMFSA